MNRRQFLFRSSLLAAGAVFPFKFFVHSQGDFNSIRRNVGYFTERGGTIGWLASPNGMVVIDSQYPETAKNCLNGLRERTDHSLDIFINTHHHGDHTAGNPVFKEVAEKMVGHDNVPKLMKKAAKEGDGEGNKAYPTTTFSDSWDIEIGDEIVHAKHYGPGHTSGDSVIYFENANVVHMGDLMFNRMNPYTDRPAGGSITNWIEILDEIADEYPSDAYYIFGHGKPAAGVTGSKKDLEVMRSYLSAIIEDVQNGVERDLSKEKITDKKVLDGFEDFLYADFWTLSDNLEVAYQEITQS